MSKPEKEKSLYDIMEEVMNDVAAQICEQVCKYNELYGEDEDKEDELYAICEKCPLNRLI